MNWLRPDMLEAEAVVAASLLLDVLLESREHRLLAVRNHPRVVIWVISHEVVVRNREEYPHKLLTIHHMLLQFLKWLRIALELIIIVELPDNVVLAHQVLLAWRTFGPSLDEANLFEKCQELLHGR